MDTSGKKVVELNIEDVLPNRFQPRIKFNEEAISELSKSIKEHGVIQPIVVRPIGDKFEIIAGERRYKASCMAELKTIPAIITDLNDKDSAEVALIENVQRENLTPIEEAISYKKILDMGYITQDALATKLGKTQSTVANKLRLLNLDDEVQEALLNEKISERHARSLLKLTDKTEQQKMLNRIITERLTVRKADEEIDKVLNGNIEEQPTKLEENNMDNNQFKFINIPEKQQEESFKFIKETIDQPTTNEITIEESDKTSNEITKEENEEEIKSNKFFNILNEEEPTQKEENNTFSFDNMFINTPLDPETSNNAMLTELNEIETSINNSSNIPPIFNNEPSAQNNNQTIKEEFDDDMEFIDEEEINNMSFEIKEEPENTDEKTESVKTMENIEQIENTQEQNEVKEEPQLKLEPRINNFKDVLQEIRNCSDRIEKAGFVIETEEYDLNGTYQVVFKINNED